VIVDTGMTWEALKDALDRLDRNDQEAATLLRQHFAVTEAARELLTHRVGELPTLGYIKDNDRTRAAIGRLAAAVKKVTP
jgi:hypothetical protein